MPLGRNQPAYLGVVFQWIELFRKGGMTLPVRRGYFSARFPCCSHADLKNHLASVVRGLGVADPAGVAAGGRAHGRCAPGGRDQLRRVRSCRAVRQWQPAAAGRAEAARGAVAGAIRGRAAHPHARHGPLYEPPRKRYRLPPNLRSRPADPGNHPLNWKRQLFQDMIHGTKIFSECKPLPFRHRFTSLTKLRLHRLLQSGGLAQRLHLRCKKMVNLLDLVAPSR